MKPRHRYLIAHPRDEVVAREHAEKLAVTAIKEEHDLVTYEVALKEDCPPGQMFVLYYLPKLTWLSDVVLDGPGEAQ